MNDSPVVSGSCVVVGSGVGSGCFSSFCGLLVFVGVSGVVSVSPCCLSCCVNDNPASSTSGEVSVLDSLFSSIFSSTFSLISSFAT